MPESYTHLDIKADLYWDMVQEGTYAEVEKSVGRSRTDVLTQVDEFIIAVEVQHTRLPLKTALRRMKEHTLAGYYTLWLFTPELLLYDEHYARNYKWVLTIQMLQGGMIFMPSSKPHEIIPARVDNSLVVKGDRLLTGRKILDIKDPIGFDDLHFEVNHGYNVTTCKDIEWTIYTGD